MELLLATQNPHKLEELRILLSEYGVHIHSLLDHPEIGPIDETGTTLAENALIKARTAFEITGLACIADDTGLEVEALNGEPGVYSARYAGENASYDENVEKLIDAMNTFPDHARGASFRTAAVYVDKDHEIIAHGEVAGEITRQRFGKQGFGYDPVFYVLERKKTYAQMSLDEKNQLSHRQRAFTDLLAQLRAKHPAFDMEQPIS